MRAKAWRNVSFGLLAALVVSIAMLLSGVASALSGVITVDNNDDLTVAVEDGATLNVDLSTGAHLLVDCPAYANEVNWTSDPFTYDVYCGDQPSDPEPTATEVPPTATEVPPTATEVPPTATEPAPIDNAWHAPTDHEHGDAPPAVVEQWSVDTFGHGVIYGGDEGTPNENLYKHEGFGGMTFTDDGVTVYVRTHLMTTPLGRSGPCHSYEVYAVKNGVVTGFWQGWVSYTSNRQCDPEAQNLIIQCGDSGIRPIIKVAQAACGNPPPFESWYANNIGFSWDIGVNTQQTTFADGDPQDPSTWILTGDNEPTRRVEAAYYHGRALFELNNAGISLGDWFCANNLGNDLQPSATPGAPGGCADGYLDQWISTSMTSVTFPGNSIQKTFTCPACEFPNH